MRTDSESSIDTSNRFLTFSPASKIPSKPATEIEVIVIVSIRSTTIQTTIANTSLGRTIRIKAFLPTPSKPQSPRMPPAEKQKENALTMSTSLKKFASRSLTLLMSRISSVLRKRWQLLVIKMNREETQSPWRLKKLSRNPWELF